MLGEKDEEISVQKNVNRELVKKLIMGSPEI